MQKFRQNKVSFFIECDDRSIFAIHVPSVGMSNGKAFLYVPPFAEEMNKSRSMVMLQAERFAELGFGTLILDLTGCGDSSGDHGHAYWDLWKQDIYCARDWLRSVGYKKVNFWGLRLGALLATQCCRESTFSNDALLLWQPIVRGDVFLTQFLRLRMAAELQSENRESTKEMRRKLAEGQKLEVAGYDISANLYNSIEALLLKEQIPKRSTQVLLLESTLIDPPELTPVTKSLIRVWRDHGVIINAKAVVGESFWSTQNITKNLEFLSCTETFAKELMPSSRLLAKNKERTLNNYQRTFREMGKPAWSIGPHSSHTHTEIPYTFDCFGNELIGILHLPKSITSNRGVVIIVGGPQYRVGSHRQFVLLARYLADAGIPVLRFDCRGMGDSGGEQITFEESVPDILAAVESLCSEAPTTNEVVLWGLCDAASAICFSAHRDHRITGVVLLNPWVRTDSSEAQTIVKHYYKDRIKQLSFWKNIFLGKVNYIESIDSLLNLIHRTVVDISLEKDEHTLPDRMAISLKKFRGNIMLILSGNDLTADEFRDVSRRNPLWDNVMNKKIITRLEIPDSNHTFSKRIWRDQVAEWTRDFVLL